MSFGNADVAVEFIGHIKTYPSDVAGMIAVLEDHAKHTEKQGNEYYDHNLIYNKHEKTVRKIADLAMSERHPERVNDVFASLRRIGTKRAAFAITRVMENHFLNRVRQVPEGKRGNLRYNHSTHHLSAQNQVQLNGDGFKALIAIGDHAVPALYKLSFIYGHGKNDPKAGYKNIDGASAQQVVDALIEIGTPHALKAIADIAYQNPNVEDYALEKIRGKRSAAAARALVHFGASAHITVSEAYSSRANVAFNKILHMYESRDIFKISEEELKGMRQAAATLAREITSDTNLRNRFRTGQRFLFETSQRTGAEDSWIQAREGDRVPFNHTKNELKEEVKGLKRLFKEAMKIGLLDEKDPSLETLVAFDKYKKVQRKRERALNAA